MIVRFELTMPKSGSWNSVDTGKKEGCYIFRNLQRIKSKTIVEKSFFYDFGDGWFASVKVEYGKRSKSAGFRGYDWMVDEIIEHGKILTKAEREEKKCKYQSKDKQFR